MKDLLQHRVFRNFISAVIFALLYSLLSFIDKGNVEIRTVLISSASYFILMCLFYLIDSKLNGRKNK